MRLAQFISFILNPLFILILLPFFVVYRTTYSITSAIGWTSYSFLFLLAIGIFMVYGVRRGFFTDLDVSKREQRPLLFSFLLITGIVYIAGLYVLHAPLILKVMAIGMMFGVLFVGAVNRKIKASLHVAILTALIVGVVLIYGENYSYLFLLIPIVGWARVRIERHTLHETIAGWIVGSLVSLGIYGFLKMFVY